MFYVYSIGWNKNTDGKRVLPTMSKEEGQDYAWPQRKKPNEAYYNLSFSTEGIFIGVLSTIIVLGYLKFVYSSFE